MYDTIGVPLTQPQESSRLVISLIVLKTEQISDEVGEPSQQIFDIDIVKASRAGKIHLI